MNHRTHRLRRLVASVTLGVGTVAGAVGLTAGAAGAATLATAKISATSTTVAHVGTNQPAGTVTVTFPAGTIANTSVLHLAIANTPPAGTVIYSSVPTVVGTNVHATAALATPTTLAITLTTKITGTTATVKVSGIKYTTADATSTASGVKVTPSLTAGGTAVKFTPTSVMNAKYPAPVAKAPGSLILKNLTTRPEPPVGVGATGAAAGSWQLVIGGTKTEGVGKGSYVTIHVAPHTGTNSCTTTNAVAFDGTPTVTLTSKATHVSGTVKFTVSEHGTGTGCSTKFAPNSLKITFTNTVSFAATGGEITLMITGVKYSTAFTTTPGTVTVSDGYFRFAGATAPNFVTGTVDDAAQTPPITSTNAIVSRAYVTANTPAVTMPANAYDHAISPVKVVESVAGSVPKGYVCLSIADSERTPANGWNTTLDPTATGPNYFNASAKPTVKVTGGNGVASTVHFLTVAGTTATIVAFKVTTASTSASTYVISGLAVNSDNGFFLPPVVTAQYASTATCNTVTGKPTDNVAVAYTTTPSTSQIYGATADATAAAELQTAFPGTGTFGKCPGLDPTNFNLTSVGQRPVVLARDSGYSDALASQYLSQYLNTGTLVTPTTVLSTVTAAAIRHEGITEVYVVGGPLAVSTAVVDQLESTPVYHCGGRNLQTTTTGAPVYIQVQRIYGATEYATAQEIAQYVPTTQVATLDLAGAYAGTNATKGNGKYNDTAGSASTAPTVTGPQRSAILATGTTFQDAESSSAASYSEQLPILLTTPTALPAATVQALQTLNISQVVVMGGPLAVSNTVVTALQGMGISVLRVGGKTYVDTSVQLADFEAATTAAHLGLGWTPFGDVMVAHGTGFTDGIAGAVVEHHFNRLNTAFNEGEVPLVLTQSPTQVGAPLTAFLKSAHSTGIDGTATNTLTTLTVLGGPLAVSPAVVTQMEQDLGH